VNEISSEVEGFSASGKLLKESSSQDSQKKQWQKRSYVERLAFTRVLPATHDFTSAELDRLIAMNKEEQKWRISFFDFLIGVGLLPELKALSLEELRRFIFMGKDEQKHWIDKLTEQKAQGAQDKEPEPHGQQTQWQDREKRRAAEIHEDTVSIEVKTLPQVRDDIKALATAKGLHTQEYVEHLIVGAINKNPDLVIKGEEYLKRFKGNITAARRYAISQKLSHLEALEIETSTRSR
jgi:hypothetical protein